MAKPKQKRKSLLQSQREKLARQRAARRAAQRANQQIQQSTRRALPSRGRTTATSPRARVQRGLTRDRLAKQQLQNFGRALQRTMKQRGAQDKLDRAARGTKGGQTRTAGGAGQLARRGGGSSSPTSQRIQPVRVRVEGQKQLPGAKKPAGQLSAAKPKLKPASGGSSGSLSGGSGARNLLKGAKGARGRGGLLGTALMGATGAAASSGLLGKKVQDSVTEFGDRTKQVLKPGFFNVGGGGKSKPRRVRGAGATGQGGGRASVNRKPKETKPKRGEPIRNRRGRVVGYKPVKPARRGMSNIPPKEGTGQGSPNDKQTTTKAKTTPSGGGSKTVKKSEPRVSGVGPVKSGEAYATAVTGKSKTQRDAESLREMQKRSKERQKAQKPKLSKRKQMLNRKKDRLEAQASGPGASARDKFFNRKARRYS